MTIQKYRVYKQQFFRIYHQQLRLFNKQFLSHHKNENVSFDIALFCIFSYNILSTSTSVIALAAISGTDAIPGVRKVPPRTPSQRLETLFRFANEYILANVVRVRPDKRSEKNYSITMRQYNAMKKNYEKMR